MADYNLICALLGVHDFKLSNNIKKKIIISSLPQLVEHLKDGTPNDEDLARVKEYTIDYQGARHIADYKEVSTHPFATFYWYRYL